jgi:hypothetical protein
VGIAVLVHGAGAVAAIVARPVRASFALQPRGDRTPRHSDHPMGAQSRPLIDLVCPEGIDADGEIRPGATSTEFSQQSYGAPTTPGVASNRLAAVAQPVRIASARAEGLARLGADSA